MGVGRHSDRLQADSLDAGPPAGGHEQPVTPQVRAVAEVQDKLGTVAAGGAGMHPEDQLDSVPAQGLRERLAERLRLAGQHPVRALDDHRLAAETADDLR